MTGSPFPLLGSALSEQIEKHAFSETKTEVGGILVGTLEQDGAVVTAAIPALKAEGGATNVTFTHDVWADVLDQIDDKYQGQQVVGWYHTHPSFGLFLSDYDLFIHQNFFSDERMCALVIDPVAGELGWFGYRDGEIKEVGRAKTRTAPIRHAAVVEHAEAGERSRFRTAMVAAVGLIAVAGVGAFIWGRSSAPSDTSALANANEQSSQMQSTINAQNQQIKALQDQVSRDGTPSSRPSGSASSTVRVYGIVRPGDSWWSIASRYLGDGSRWPEIKAANPSLQGINPGDQIVIPGVRQATVK